MLPLKLRFHAAAMAAALTVLPVASAHAQDNRGVVYVSGYAGEDSNASVGFTVALDSLGTGLTLRGSLMAGSYDYGRAGSAVEASYRGGDLALAYQWSDADFYTNVGLGARLTETELTPPDPGNPRQGDHWDMLATVDGARTFGGLRLTGYASYGFRMEEYYARVDATHAIGASNFRLGAEAGIQGDPNYERQVYGLVATVKPNTAWELRASAGMSRQGSGNAGYGTVGIVRVF